MNSQYDLAVIGGGVIGTSVAYYNAKRGMDVILIERNTIASGSSSGCEGDFLISDKMPGYDSELSKLSLKLYESLRDELEIPIEISHEGSLLVADNEIEMEKMKEFCRIQEKAGFPVRMMDHKELHEEVPMMAEDVQGALETKCDGALNPMKLCSGFAYQFKKTGGRIWTEAQVNNIKIKPDRTFRVETAKGDIEAKRVVNCAGVWAPEIGKMVGLDIPIIPRQGQLLISEQTPLPAPRKIYEFGYMMTKFQTEEYKRSVPKAIEEEGVTFNYAPTAHNNFILGGSRKFSGFDVSTDIRVMKAIAQRAIRFIPALSDIKIIRSFAGLRPYTKDHMPIISDSPVPGYYIAAGHEGEGISFSPITGVLMAQLIAEETPDIDMGPLRFERFFEAGRFAI